MKMSWSSADRRCSNNIWVINNDFAYKGATYIRCLTVYPSYNAEVITYPCPNPNAKEANQVWYQKRCAYVLLTNIWNKYMEASCNFYRGMSLFRVSATVHVHGCNYHYWYFVNPLLIYSYVGPIIIQCDLLTRWALQKMFGSFPTFSNVFSWIYLFLHVVIRISPKF